MIHTKIDGEVSLNLNEAQLSDAMEEVLDGDSNLSYMVENKNLHIFRNKDKNQYSSNHNTRNLSSKDQIDQKPIEPVIVKMIRLTQRSASEIQKIIKDTDGTISCVFDVPTNTLILHGKKSSVEKAEEICNALDKSNALTKQNKLISSIYITKVFVLEHADFESVEKELENVIERETNNSSSSSGSSNTKNIDKNGVPVDNEYFLLDKSRRTVVVHTIEPKMQVIEAYFKAINNPLPQVIIEAQIVSVKESLNRTLGINWNTVGSYLAPSTPWNTNSNPDTPFQYGKWDLSASRATFQAAQTNGDIKILSRPRILVVSGTEASIHVGEELPYVTSQSVSDGGTTTQSVEYKQVGVKLDVTPTINPSSKSILLKLTPEVSEELDPIIINGNRVPVITTRKTESTVEVYDGETMVIGGLLKNEENAIETGIPVLRNLPGFLGKMFKSKTIKKEQTNLMILLTPKIVSEEFKDTVSYKATKAYNEMKKEIIEKLSKPLVASEGKVKVVDTDPDIYNVTELKKINSAGMRGYGLAEEKTDDTQQKKPHNKSLIIRRHKHNTTEKTDNVEIKEPEIKVNDTIPEPIETIKNSEYKHSISDDAKAAIEKLRKKLQTMNDD